MYNLAKNGMSVIGFDIYNPPHTMGSSHGNARVIRKSYSEGSHFVPLLNRSYELFFELQDQTNLEIIKIIGGIMIAKKGANSLEGIKHSSEVHNCEIEILTSDDIRSRWKIFNPEEEMEGVLDLMGGAVFPENVINTNLNLSKEYGAELHFNTKISKWISDDNYVTLQTETGDTYYGDKLIICAGAWLPNLLNDLKLPIFIERQVLFWFDPISNSEIFLPENSPNHSWEYEDGKMIYIQPNFGDGIKAAIHHEGYEVNPDKLDRKKIHQDDEEKLRSIIKSYIPDLDVDSVRSAVCMYTNTPDREFIIDFHPDYSNVLILSPCSGHGFKFSPVIGEIAFNLINNNKSKFNINSFSIERLL